MEKYLSRKLLVAVGGVLIIVGGVLVGNLDYVQAVDALVKVILAYFAANAAQHVAEAYRDRV